MAAYYGLQLLYQLTNQSGSSQGTCVCTVNLFLVKCEHIWFMTLLYSCVSSVADLLLSNKPLLNKLTSFITMVRNALAVMEEEMIGTHTQPYHCVCTLFVRTQESVAGGRQCVTVSLELVGSLVESYQHGLSDVSIVDYLYSSCIWGSYQLQSITTSRTIQPCLWVCDCV